MLDGRMPQRRARIECGSADAILGLYAMIEEDSNTATPTIRLRASHFANLILPLFVFVSAQARAQTNSIQFDRDIRPILQTSCIRCHGGERPKSGLSLTDRESALKGGQNHTDVIIPGNGASSRLVQFVSGQPEDMLMPPEGKGDPLTPEQIELLRRWIDEGANWGEPAKPEFEFIVSPSVRWVEVNGDKNKFREIEGFEPGWAGGIEHFSLTQELDRLTKLRADGHFLSGDQDGAFKLSIDRRDTGFVRFGVEQWRSFYDDTGGFYRASPLPTQDLARELHLDHGRAWIDLGLTKPNWPALVLGYEYQFRDGDKSTLQWGPVNGRHTFPSSKHIDEEAHILKLDVTMELGGWELEDNARVEFYDLATSRDNAITNSFVLTTGLLPNLIERAAESVSHVQGVNSFRAEKQLYEGWRFSSGYLFSRYDGESRLTQTTLDHNFLPVGGEHFWSGDEMILRRDTHVWSLANLFQPLDDLSATVAAQAEWTRQDGAGDVSLDHGNPLDPPNFKLEPAQVNSDMDRLRWSEQAGLRFTGLPWTVAFAEARLDQESVSQFEELTGQWHDSFQRDTDATMRRTDARAGFTTSPWSWLSLGGNYRDRRSDSDYDHTVGYKIDPGGGYSAFIRGREIDSREWEARLVLRPVRWLKTTVTYDRVDSDYSTSTDPLPGQPPGGWLTAARYDADVFGASLGFTPCARLQLNSTFSYSATRTVSADDGNPSVVPYEGDVISVIASGRFVLNERTELFAAYGFTRADYGQGNHLDGLPLGMEFTRHSMSGGFSRKLSAACSVSLRYAYYRYDDPGSGGANDYSAHGVFATFNYRWQ